MTDKKLIIDLIAVFMMVFCFILSIRLVRDYPTLPSVAITVGTGAILLWTIFDLIKW